MSALVNEKQAPERLGMAFEKHYSAQDVAELWGVSRQTVTAYSKVSLAS